MCKADKKKAKQDTQAPVSPAGVTDLADEQLKQVQGGLSSREQPLIKPRK
ncbi:MAG TPA: mersacidin/lichenicidin family type 2 lantibiotic [Ktedonobacterales bacterium]|jgi:mersacidin/lichenicidin family type 2 lantibiotic